MQRWKGAEVQGAKVQRCKGAKGAKLAETKKIRGQANKQTDKVTSSLLELLVAAKNIVARGEE